MTFIIFIVSSASKYLINLSSQYPCEMRVWYYPHFTDGELKYREFKVKKKKSLILDTQFETLEPEYLAYYINVFKGQDQIDFSCTCECSSLP